MMMANVHGGDLFAYKIIEIPNDPADTVHLRSTDVGVTALSAWSGWSRYWAWSASIRACSAGIPTS